MKKKNTDISSKSGKVRISEEVVSRIAYYAAKETEGVADIPATLPTYLAGMVKKGSAKGVTVKALEDGSLRIDVCISVRYGTVIPAVSRKIQDAVITSVKSMTGITVSVVNIHIASVIFDD
ncbi:MAG: Asp23/Gls24 family envelope stress response protein [Lachnospiraceae bacterium]|nr:Asp23/Gls24 family envelope stress response protein [Lachnospiraceae bacterium]